MDRQRRLDPVEALRWMRTLGYSDAEASGDWTCATIRSLEAVVQVDGSTKAVAKIHIWNHFCHLLTTGGIPFVQRRSACGVTIDNQDARRAG